MADESAGPALPGEMKPLFLVATAVVSALQEVDYEPLQDMSAFM
jgi:hypothetical protein